MTKKEFENRDSYILRSLREDRVQKSRGTGCVGVCKLQEDKVCIGCNRTIEEIAEAGRKK